MDLDEFLAAEAAVAACERARSRAEVLHTELSAEQETCQRLRRRLQDEQRSKRRSIGRFLDRLRGRRVQPTPAEHAEVAAMSSELAAHERAMQRLSVEFRSVRDEAAGLDEARSRLAAATAARAEAIAAAGDERARRLGSLDTELAAARRRRDELSAAHRSALGAAGALEVAIGRLGTAQGWSTADILTDGSGGFRHGTARFGGDVAGLAKHDSLDNAMVPIAEAHAALLLLRAELADLGGLAGAEDDLHRPNVRMPSSRLATWDIWFDNTFSDLMVHDRITSSISELQRAHHHVEELISELSPPTEAANTLVADLERRRTDLLRS